MKKHSNFFDENGHLNDAGIVLWSDAMRLKREHDLPEDLQEHLELCAQCRMNVFDYYEFKKEDDIAELANHHYFSQKAPAIAKPPTQTPARKIAAKTINLQRKLSIAASILVLLVAGWWATQHIGKFSSEANNIVKKNTNDTARNKSTSERDPNTIEKNLSQNMPLKKKEEKIPQEDRKEKKKSPQEVKQTPLTPVFSEAIAMLDQKIARNTRGAHINTPTLDAAYAQGQAILFQWKTEPAEAFELRVFNKKTQGTPQIIQINGSISQHKFTKSLTKGKYYWRLFRVNQGRKQEIGIGRFNIK